MRNGSTGVLLRRNVPHVDNSDKATRFADQRRRLVAAVESINFVAVSQNAEPKDRSGPRRGVSRRVTAKTQTLCEPCLRLDLAERRSRLVGQFDQ